MVLASASSSEHSTAQSLQLQGTIGGQAVTILVDSGSTHSFISSSVAQHLSGLRPLQKPVSVQVANGVRITCDTEIPMAEWSVQQHKFHSTLKVLDIGSYDMIVGMDWLQAFSPMKIDWQAKWMLIPYGSTHISLQGILPDSSCSVLKLYSITSEVPAPDVEPRHPQLQLLLDEFSHLFTGPTALPRRRPCDHTIPLVPGAQPVSVRPYRYAPALKTEIEKQVSEMLQQGLIRPSTSPFSSPVLLVRKKDNTWRFCVDYRMLNALTLKSKFPIPVIDELLDELSGASWFSTLDLRAGFNQIRLAPGEEFKTAFQTHWGHFEFNVMAFGLTGAPNTFQGAMNSTLRPVLRICALVFFDDILIYSRTFEEHLEHLRQVFSLLSQDQWQLKLSKCKFAQQRISYLGHVVSG